MDLLPQLLTDFNLISSRISVCCACVQDTLQQGQEQAQPIPCAVTSFPCCPAPAGPC